MLSRCYLRPTLLPISRLSLGLVPFFHFPQAFVSRPPHVSFHPEEHAPRRPLLTDLSVSPSRFTFPFSPRPTGSLRRRRRSSQDARTLLAWCPPRVPVTGCGWILIWLLICAFPRDRFFASRSSPHPHRAHPLALKSLPSAHQASSPL